MTKPHEPRPDFNPRPTYTPDEVAEIFGVTMLTVRRWVREGRIQSVKFGRLIRISHDEMLRVCREGLLPPREKEGEK